MTSADHPGAYAYGVATLTLDGTVLDVWYPEPRLGAAPSLPAPEGELRHIEPELGPDVSRGPVLKSNGWTIFLREIGEGDGGRRVDG